MSPLFNDHRFQWELTLLMKTIICIGSYSCVTAKGSKMLGMCCMNNLWQSLSFQLTLDLLHQLIRSLLLRASQVARPANCANLSLFSPQAAQIRFNFHFKQVSGLTPSILRLGGSPFFPQASNTYVM